MVLFAGAVGQHGFYGITNCQSLPISLVSNEIINAHLKATAESLNLNYIKHTVLSYLVLQAQAQSI
jgi:hypothetical protein